MKYINTGKPVKLKTLIVSGEIGDESRIQIFNNSGSLLACGRWYQDQILEYVDKIGTATKAGTGLSVKFKLSHPPHLTRAGRQPAETSRQ